MTTQKQISELPSNHATTSANFDRLNTSSNTLETLLFEGIYGTINSCNYELKT